METLGVGAMRPVMFSFRSDTSPEQQDAVLAELEGWPEIRRIARLAPDAPDPVLFSMCYAYLEEHINEEPVVRRMTELPEVEAAELPAERGLV